METKGVSKAQIEVWEWKEKAAEGIENLPVGERIRFIMARTKKLAAEIQANSNVIVKTPNKILSAARLVSSSK